METRIGAALTRKRTAPHAQPPVCSTDSVSAFMAHPRLIVHTATHDGMRCRCPSKHGTFPHCDVAERTGSGVTCELCRRPTAHLAAALVGNVANAEYSRSR